jgi:hypothetical protein
METKKLYPYPKNNLDLLCWSAELRVFIPCVGTLSRAYGHHLCDVNGQTRVFLCPTFHHKCYYRFYIFTAGECVGRPVYRLPAAGEGIPGCAQAEELPGPQSWTGNICNF